MSEPLSAALLGTWHVHADDYARETSEHPGTRLATVWDADADAAREAGERFGVPSTDDLDAVLADPAVGGVIVTTATTEHSAVIGRALRAGKHVFTEKLLAPTTDEAEALVALAAQQGVALVVSLPRLTEPTTLAVLDLLDRSALGRITYARVRMAHDGWIGGWLPERFADASAAVGGALSDLGAHPVYLVQRFLGARPESISASYTAGSGHAVEDNAVVTAAYADGAIGVAEASFVTVPGAFAFEVRGTAGSVLYGFGGERLLAKGAAFDPEAWTELPLPAPGRTPFDLWVAAAAGEADTAENLSAAVALTTFVAAANSAAADGTAVRLP